MKQILSKEELSKISSTISEVEKQTSGEIRVVVKKRLSFFEKRKKIRDLAFKEFYKLKMNETKDKTGVMIYILVKEKKFEIIADEGIQNKVAPFYWDVISQTLSERFLHNEFCKGICDFVNEVGIVLIKEFPIKHDDKNELSNEVIIS
ncbi:MAG: TPM domain-containing protein [Bacteroidota bacterium]